jgi:glucosamine-6-phosphate deaminase
MRNIKDLKVSVFDSRQKLGEKAAEDISKKIKELLENKSELRIVFAAAPSQNEMLEFLIKSKEIEWNKIIAFHMDEYIGLQKDANQLFSKYLCDHVFDHVPFKKVHLINGNNTLDECQKYGELLSEAPIDIVCMGIGENGHIAFNDPSVADFEDTKVMKKVELDQICRQQQVNDGCFAKIDDVPQHAYSLTVPTLMSASHLFCVVPGRTKKEAVQQTLYNPQITTQWPSTILRKHKSCNFYFDNDSFGVK